MGRFRERDREIDWEILSDFECDFFVGRFFGVVEKFFFFAKIWKFPKISDKIFSAKISHRIFLFSFSSTVKK